MLIDPTSDNLVRAEGPTNARIMLIGEAPGETEVKQRRPFVGMAGKTLDGILEEAGIVRDACYITNIMQIRPANNKFRNFYTKESGKLVQSPELLEGIDRLHNEICAVHPNVIVTLGTEPMKAVLGFGGIMDYRGSILESKWGKVIPAIHPSAIFRDWVKRPCTVCDFIRIREQAAFPEVRITHRNIEVLYDTDKAVKYIEALKEKDLVAFDIETETDQITCISFSGELHHATSIPFWFGSSGSFRSQEEETAVWGAIRGLLESDKVKKVAHNGAFDWGVLRRVYNINVRNLYFDTMVGMHALYLELPKSLAFASSIYTDQPYYKSDIKSPVMDVYFRYNARDSCVTLEVYYALIKDMEEFGVLDFYFERMHSLIEPLLMMELQGVRFGYEPCLALRKVYRNQIKMLQEKLNRQAGRELNVGSPKQMIEWLYNELKLPKQYKTDKTTGEKRLTTNEDAIDTLSKKVDNPAFTTVLELREKKKILSTYLEVKLDEDKRIRCSYNLTGTETGRLSSSTTVRGTGTNLQNVPEGEIRSLFIPDPGKVFINGDLSQAEARVVAYLACERRLIEILGNGGDIHKKNAANIFGKKEEEVTDDERQLAKRVIHGSHYAMGSRTFAGNVGIPEQDARRLLNQYFVTYPRIKVWHMQIRNSLNKSRFMQTPLGRRRIFYNRWSESLIKEGLAYVPQSTVADILNQGLLCLWKKIQAGLPVDLLLQVHDSILVQCDKGFVPECVKVMQECLTVPVEINGMVLTIPCDFKVGDSWGNLKKYRT